MSEKRSTMECSPEIRVDQLGKAQLIGISDMRDESKFISLLRLPETDEEHNVGCGAGCGGGNTGCI